MANELQAIECPHCEELFPERDVNAFAAYQCEICETIYDSIEEADACCPEK